MARRRVVRIAALVTTALGVLAVGPPAVAATSPISLQVPEGTAFAILGHWCGGIQQNVFGSGFDPGSGYPNGDAYVWTTCSAGGRGGHSTTYSAWVAAEWDFTGALVSDSILTSAPSVDPTLSVFDVHGNQLVNQSNRANLVLAAGFVPAPRISGVTPNSAPQGTTVTVSGTGFTGATGVMFGSTAAASFTVNSDTSVTAVAPAVRTGTVDVTVTGPGGTSATNPGDQFTFVLTPRVSGLQPARGSADGGTKVTITGVNFSHATAVRFGGIAARFKVVNRTSIIATSPPVADPVAVDVTVTSAYGTSAVGSVDLFTYF